ncbi:TK [Mytilus edulis]|uniref:Thymidine kinase n=1 Tax=Mytilus edulis TaxID=6550 RepID=A0A8S3RKK1_MYTED|nr:TK [Mytilus edulis]
MCSTGHIFNSPRLNKSPRGQIQVIFGPMFSGKTTELMRRMKRYQIANYKCLVIKYSKDDRYDKEGIATHDKQTLPAVPAEKLDDVLVMAENFEVIGVDEGQFFPDVVSFSDEMAERGKTVIVAALDGTFQKKVEIIGGADKYLAVCRSCFKSPLKSPRKHETPPFNSMKESKTMANRQLFNSPVKNC